MLPPLDLVHLAGNNKGVVAGKLLPALGLVVKGALMGLCVTVGTAKGVTAAAGESGVSDTLVALEATVGVLLYRAVVFGG